MFYSISSNNSGDKATRKFYFGGKERRRRKKKRNHSYTKIWLSFYSRSKHINVFFIYPSYREPRVQLLGCQRELEDPHGWLDLDASSRPLVVRPANAAASDSDLGVLGLCAAAGGGRGGGDQPRILKENGKINILIININKLRKNLSNGSSNSSRGNENDNNRPFSRRDFIVTTIDPRDKWHTPHHQY